MDENILFICLLCYNPVDRLFLDFYMLQRKVNSGSNNSSWAVGEVFCVLKHFEPAINFEVFCVLKHFEPAINFQGESSYVLLETILFLFDFNEVSCAEIHRIVYHLIDALKWSLIFLRCKLKICSMLVQLSWWTSEQSQVEGLIFYFFKTKELLLFRSISSDT